MLPACASVMYAATGDGDLGQAAVKNLVCGDADPVYFVLHLPGHGAFGALDFSRGVILDGVDEIVVSSVLELSVCVGALCCNVS